MLNNNIIKKIPHRENVTKNTDSMFRFFFQNFAQDFSDAIICREGVNAS